MGELAKLFVTVGSKFDDKGIKSGVSGADRLKAKFKAVAKSLKVVAIAGAAMGAALAVGAIKAAKAAGEQEKVEQLLAAALKASGQFTEEGFKKNLAYASSLQKMTTVGDETSIKVMQLGINMGVSADEIEGATKQSIALSKAYKVDLMASMKMVALARQGEFTMLARYIPQLRGVADKTEQLAIFNKAMAEGFSVAEAETKTYAGMVQQLNNRWGDFIEKIGFKVIPIIQILINAVNQHVMPAMEDWLDSLSDGDKLADGFVGGIKKIISTSKILSKVISIVADNLAGLALSLTFHYKSAGEAFKKADKDLAELGKFIGEVAEEEVRITEKTQKKKTEIVTINVADRLKAEEAAAEALRKKEEEALADFRKKMKERAVVVQGLVSNLSSMFNSFFKLQNVGIQNAMNSDIDASAVRYEAEKTRINNTITDETERATALQELEEGYQSEVGNIRDNAAREERKRREALKPIMIAQAIANTAVGVTKAFAELGPFGVIPAGLIAAAGAAEVATIKAQKFAKGVRNFMGGMALVGEKGPELVNLPRGADVFSNPESKQMVATGGGGGNIINISVPPIPNRAYAKLMAKLVGDEIVKKLGNSRKL